MMNAIAFAVSILVFGAADFAAPTSGQDPVLVEALWRKLRAERLVVSQRDIQCEYGLCGVACVVNAVQAVAVLNGLAPVRAPSVVFRKLLDTMPLGHVRHADVAGEIERLLRRRRRLDSIDIRVILMSHVDDGHWSTKMVRAPVTRDFRPQRRQIKLISGVEWSAADERVVNHIKLVRSVQGSRLIVVDPGNPYVDVGLTRIGRKHLTGATFRCTSMTKALGSSGGEDSHRSA